jgi:transposase-like protein
LAWDAAQVDALLGERTTLDEVDALFRQMKKAAYERILSGELTHHLGYPPEAEKPMGQANHRNRTSPKTVLSLYAHGMAMREIQEPLRAGSPPHALTPPDVYPERGCACREDFHAEGVRCATPHV